MYSGQTGSGKTFTMQGPINEDDSIDYEKRGVIPRTFDYLFQRIREEEKRNNGAVSYYCKCAYVEIYNECVYDLLDSSAGVTCTLREDSKKGVYVEGCTEAVVLNANEAFMLYEEGSKNRHVAETAMNRESSRSHCVFTITIQSKKADGAIIDVRESRFNLVDLAGSERQQVAATTGSRLKEAGNINKSLLALSNVINALVDIANGKNRHVHYRDSKLTFLLRDSLGGNSKTLIIAAVSPSPLCQAETLSTLRFAQRAKQIRNKAVVNKDIQGNVFELQAEVRRLRHENLLLRTNAATETTAVVDRATTTPESSSLEDGLIWSVHFNRMKELQAEIERLQKQLQSYQAFTQRKDEQLKSEKMVAKFRETTIQNFENQLVKKIQESGDANSIDLLEIFKQERARYKAELTELKRQVENHPEVTKYAHELMELKLKMAKLDAQRQTDFEAKVEKLHQYSDELWAKLSTYEQECLRLRNLSEEVPTRKVQTSNGPLKESQDSNGERYEILQRENSKLQKQLDILQSQKIEIVDVKVSCEEENEPVDGGKKRRLSGKSSSDSVALELLQVKLEGHIKELEEENASLKEGFTVMKNKIETKLKASQLKVHDLTALEGKLRQRLDQLEAELVFTTEKLNNSMKSNSRLHDENEELKQKVATLCKTLQESEQQLVHVTEILEKTKSDAIHSQDLFIGMESKFAELKDKLDEFEPLWSFGTSVAQIIQRITSGEDLQNSLSQRITKLEFNLQSAQHDNEDLLHQIHELTTNGPAQKLIEAETLTASLQIELSDVRAELHKIQQENEKLIQHRNIKQKLQYHVAIKEENNAFREEIRQLRDELTRLRQKNIEMEDTLRSGSIR